MVREGRGLGGSPPIPSASSSNSHLTRNEKWKLWVGWHGSSYWLLCLCVLCFVFCAVSKTIRCSQVSPISISKNENYELCISAGFFVTTGKKKVPVVCLAKEKRYSRLSVGCAVLAITTGKKKIVCLTGCAVVLFFVVAGNFDYEMLLRPEKKHVCLSCRDLYICISSTWIKPNTNPLVQL